MSYRAFMGMPKRLMDKTPPMDVTIWILRSDKVSVVS